MDIRRILNMPKENEKPEKKGIPIFAPYKSLAEANQVFQEIIKPMPMGQKYDLSVWFGRFATTVNEGVK